MSVKDPFGNRLTFTTTISNLLGYRPPPPEGLLPREALKPPAIRDGYLHDPGLTIH